MKRLTLFILAIFAVSLVAVAQSGMMASDNPASGQNGAMMTGNAPQQSTGTMMSGNAPQPSGAMMTATKPAADPMVGNQLRYAMSSGKKVIFTDLMAAETIAKSGPTVLFFAADWCPYCQADLKDINANGSRLKNITVVVLDYDKTADLKTRYGVTAQDSFVQIDSKGAKVGVWNGGGVDGILSHVQKAM